MATYRHSVRRRNIMEWLVPRVLSWRVGQCVTLFFGCMVLYILRICMGLAVVCMVKNPTVKNSTITTTVTPITTSIHDANASGVIFVSAGNDVVSYADECGNIDGGSKQPQSNGELNWNRETQGYVLSSFFMGYFITQIPGGYLSTRFGSRWLIFMAGFMTGVPAFFIPVAARQSPYLVMTLRIIQGIFGGVFFPSLHATFGKWAPPLERSKMVSMTFTGSSIGSMLAFIFTGLLCKYGYAGGWPSIFYTYAPVCVLWSFIWLLTGYSSPADHPYISDIEREYIETSIGDTEEKKPPTPWRPILTSTRVWAIVLCDIGANWVSYTILTGLPLYMKDVLKLDIQGNGFFNALPNLCSFLGAYFWGWLSDFLLQKRVFGISLLRKIFVVVGAVPPGVLLIITGYFTCHQRYAALVMLCLANFFRVTYAYIVNILDIAPKFSGIIYGISNTCGQIMGILSPIAIGYLTKNKTQTDWQNVFYLSAVFSIVPSIFFLIFGSGLEQSWAKVNRENGDSDKEKKDELNETELKETTKDCVSLDKENIGLDNKAFQIESKEIYRKIHL